MTAVLDLVGEGRRVKEEPVQKLKMQKAEITKIR